MRRRSIVLFVLAVAIYNSNFRRVGAHDTWANAFQPFCIALEGSLTLDCVAGHFFSDPAFSDQWIEKRGDRFYSTYGLTYPLLVSPIYLPFRLAGPWSPERIVNAAWPFEKIVASVTAALAAVAMLRLLNGVAPAPWVWYLGLAFTFGTSLWATASQSMWLHAPAIGAMAMAYGDLTKGRTIRAGLWSGLAVAIRPLAGTLALAGCITFLLRRDWLNAVRFGGGAAVAFAPWAILNWIVLGTPIPAPNLGEKAFVAPFWEAVVGVFLAPSRGLFVFAPFLLLVLWRLPSRVAESFLSSTAVVQIALHVAVMSGWSWWGGHSFGPRLMLDTSAAFALLVGQAAPALDRDAWLRPAFHAAIAWSVIVQWTGAFCYPNGEWDNLPVGVDRAHHRVWAIRDSQIERTLRAGPLWPDGWRIRVSP